SCYRSRLLRVAPEDDVRRPQTARPVALPLAVAAPSEERAVIHMEDFTLRDLVVARIDDKLAFLVDDFGVAMAADEYIHAFPCVGQVLHMIEFATGPPRSCRAVSVVDGVDHALQVAVARPEGHLHNAPSPVEGNAQLLCDLL